MNFDWSTLEFRVPCREGYDTDAVPRLFVERHGVPVEADARISDAGAR